MWKRDVHFFITQGGSAFPYFIPIRITKYAEELLFFSVKFYRADFAVFEECFALEVLILLRSRGIFFCKSRPY
jgi:hypothetical protein